jgi:hypothetical protein
MAWHVLFTPAAALLSLAVNRPTSPDGHVARRAQQIPEGFVKSSVTEADVFESDSEKR